MAKPSRLMVVVSALAVSSFFFLMGSADEEVLEETLTSSDLALSWWNVQEMKAYTKTWPEMEFGWRIVVGSLIGFMGGAFGTVGGVGGGGFFVPMLTLIIGFDTKSSTAISKCMIMGAAGSAVMYNIKQRHPTLDLPVIDYDLALLFQPMLVLGISIGVIFNVIFSKWMVTVLLILIFLGASSKTFLMGVEAWKRETFQKREAGQRLETNDLGMNEIEYQPLPQESIEERKMSVISNVNWKEVGILLAVWMAILALQIIKNYSTTCSTLYWIANLMQIPVTVGASGHKAFMLYKRRSVLASRGEVGQLDFTVLQLFVYCALGLLSGVVGGLLGLGGGLILGSLFIEMGIPPQVAGATATFAMTFSSSLLVIEYYLLKRFPISYALYLVVVASTGAPVGQYSMKRVNSFLGRASPIIFILALTLCVSAISLGGEGITRTLYLIKHHEYMGFESLCSSNSS